MIEKLSRQRNADASSDLLDNVGNRILSHADDIAKQDAELEEVMNALN